MAQSHDTTTRIQIRSHAYIEGPSEYLDNISTCLLALLVALLAAPPRSERAACIAFQREAQREGLDADDVAFLLMACTLSDDRDTRDDEAA